MSIIVLFINRNKIIKHTYLFLNSCERIYYNDAVFPFYRSGTTIQLVITYFIFGFLAFLVMLVQVICPFFPKGAKTFSCDFGKALNQNITKSAITHSSTYIIKGVFVSPLTATNRVRFKAFTSKHETVSVSLPNLYSYLLKNTTSVLVPDWLMHHRVRTPEPDLDFVSSWAIYKAWGALVKNIH